MALVDSFVGHSFSHSMNTHEPNMRFQLIDGSLDSFFLWVRMSSWTTYRVLLLVHDIIIVMLLLVLLMLLSLEILIIFLMIASSFSTS
jgi:hypothetical protein